jgi:spore coat protein A
MAAWVAATTGGGAYHFELPEILQFRVSESASSEDDSAHPTELDLPNRSSYSENAVTETRHMTMRMKMANGLPTHVLNGKTFHEDPAEDEYPEPQLGTTEVWELQNDTMHTHPIHVHLVDFEVIGRGEDGTEDPLPNERGPKDVVRVNPGETVRIITKFGDFTGTFPWHCHILEHEEVAMMRPSEVVSGNSDGGTADGEGDEHGDRSGHSTGNGHGNGNGN